ncbi:MAG: hypothetical protein LC634_05430 [Sphingomonadales bacterium]|nr:hypothetical protein [Sphingomonadales bacterium]
MTNSNFRAALLIGTAAVTLAGCGADDVASPGEGNIVVIPAPPPPPPPSSGPADSCPSGTTDAGVIANNRACQLPSLITSTLTLQDLDGVIYAMNGRVEVGVDVGGDGNEAGGDPASLNIDPGVTIFAQSAATFLVVNRGSQINANGSDTAPIIMTSRQNILGNSTDADSNQWGGVLILGRAPISNCIGNVQGGSADCQQLAEGAGPDDFYGGDAATDDSGTFRYVQLRYTGQASSPNRELQGLTLAGVGRNTTVEYVQSHNSGDDGIEIFGGGVNLRYILITGADDDGYDTDLGYVGATQFMINVQRPNAGDTSWEIDSDDDSAFDATPRQDAKLANFTFIHRKADDKAIHLRGGPDITFLNGVVVGTGFCLDVDTAESVQTSGPDENGPPVFRSVIFDCDVEAFDSDGDNFEAVAFNASGDANNDRDYNNTLSSIFINGNAENGVDAVANITSFSSFFTQVDYIGAVRDANDTWYRNWSCNASYVSFSAPVACVDSPAS